MTRSEFEHIEDFEDLIQFCTDHGLDFFDNIVYGWEMDGFIEEDIVEYLKHKSWCSLIEALINLRGLTGDLFKRSGLLEYEALDQVDFTYYFHAILDWADSNGVFDPEEEENSSEPGDAPVAQLPKEPEFDVDGAVFDEMFPLSSTQ